MKYDLIAIDTEFHTDSNGRIDNVFCIAASKGCDSDSRFTQWTKDCESEDILDVIMRAFGTAPESTIFICHAFDLAERRALKHLGVDCSKYKFLDTFHLARMLELSFDRSLKSLLKDGSIDESLRIRVANRLKLKKDYGLSYAGLCRKYSLALIDTNHKQEMRQLCIDDLTLGHEQEIMAYCFEDTEFLIPLFKCLFSEYYNKLRGSYCPMCPHVFDHVTAEEALQLLTTQTSFISDLGDIADAGLPVNIDRVKKAKANARLFREKSYKEFADKYPGTYTYDERTNRYKRSEAVVQKYLSELVDAKYPRTDRGKLSTSTEDLKTYFKGQDNFGGDFYNLCKLTTSLNMAAKDYGNPFDRVYNGRLWYGTLEPYKAVTSRNGHKPAQGFVFGMHKMFYGVLEPVKGKWLVELDFGSEETFCQACICRDPVYNKIYNSKDIYLSFAALMGRIPVEDYKSMSVDELKEKYASVRKMIKPMILGISYGMGYKKLASRLNISEDSAKTDIDRINSILSTSAQWKCDICTNAKDVKAFSLPDGFICGYDTATANHTTIGNWPFQSSGAVILRSLVRRLMKLRREGDLKAEILATIHDSIFFAVDEGDYETINKVSDLMKEVANRVLMAPNGWSIKVGSPDIIKYGSLWCAGNDTYVEQFKELLNYSNE